MLFRSYAGTLYTELGIQRTKTITCHDWTDYSNQSNMNLFASEFLDCVKNIVYEGTVPYHGLLTSLLTFGQSINIAGNGYTTGWESINCPVVQVDVDFHEAEDGATTYDMQIHISSRRAPYTGDAFVRPHVVGQPFGSGEPLGLAELSHSQMLATDPFSVLDSAFGGSPLIWSPPPADSGAGGQE